ncbi:heparinase II/III family protein [Lichenifustis flavocetrariae]|uniref:Heparinase II/III family protein n=1 Tax=Lichenifustis flavocetrariae TaxID=2949735 RepID=A0AA41YZQ4_9HYPH|nr:heparinase II/III family protein [Lichenifustis flavocetrariae]MCW6510207.1 heparinase II/III family protein [Lichenifustis flavocetrariae]
MGETVALAANVARIESQRSLRLLTHPFRLTGRLNQGSPERLVIAPQDIRTADPTVADDIYAGHLVFAGRFVDAHGQSPFDIVPPSESWARSLHGFGWLRHLRAADTPLARANARALVEDWIGHCTPGRTSLAWQPDVVARRLLSWLAQSPLILDPPDAVFYRKFMKSMGRQVGTLASALNNGLAGSSRLLAAIALAETGLCAEGLGPARKMGSRVLNEELRRQILPDGGHLSRNPELLVELLLDLLPLRQAYAARGAAVPPALLATIDRILPMIRMFRHGDGSLALFNGMGVTEPDVLATVLMYDDSHTRPLANAPHSGYRRLEAGPALLICDVGRPPPPLFSEQAHAGTLSFEFSVGPQRIFVNCGRPSSSNTRVNEAARSTAAHSTLVLGYASSSSMAEGRWQRWYGRQIMAGPKSVTVRAAGTTDALGLEASHDGYAKHFGLLHQRKLTLAQDGSGLFGRDEMVPAGKHRGPPSAQDFVLRFHMHPAVEATVLEHGKAVLLSTGGGDRWIFEAGGQETRVEESIFFAVAEGPRRTDQIVVAGHFPARPAIAWSLTQLRDNA